MRPLGGRMVKVKVKVWPLSSRRSTPRGRCRIETETGKGLFAGRSIASSATPRFVMASENGAVGGGALLGCAPHPLPALYRDDSSTLYPWLLMMSEIFSRLIRSGSEVTSKSRAPPCTLWTSGRASRSRSNEFRSSTVRAPE